MAGESIRSIVQRCYTAAQEAGVAIPLSQSDLDQLSIQAPAPSGPLSPAQPVGGGPVTPADPRDVIADLVGRCYSPGVIPNAPNTLDQDNPRPSIIPPAAVPDPMPGQVIRDVIGRCYPEGILPLEDNPLDKDNPTPKTPEVPLTPEPTPNEVIQDLVGRCYPDLGDLGLPPLPIDADADFDGIEIDITDTIDWINDFVDIKFPFTGPIVTVPPDGPDGKTTVSIGKDGDQCLKVARLHSLGLLKKIGKDTYKHKETGEILKCEGFDEEDDPGWGRCVRKAVECMMRPYIGGQWLPPSPSCDTYWPSGWSANKNEICIANCYPDRLAVYEHGLGSSSAVINVRMNHRNKNGMWKQTVVTTDTSGNNTRGFIRNEGGAQIFSSNYSNTFTTSSGGISVSVSVNAIPDGGDWDSEWKINSWSGSASPGTSWTHNFNVGNNTAFLDFEVFGNVAGDTIYTTSPTPPNGYNVQNNGQPVFHILKDAIPGKTVPIFNYYSSSRVDSMLSCNPGQPDGPGQGERQQINDNGYLFQYVLGHGFITAADGLGYKRKTEDNIQPLVRLFDQPPWDHQACIDAEIPMDSPSRYLGKNSYRIPKKSRQDLRVTVDCEHGAAGYDNSLGFYLANDNGPQKGYMIVPSAKSNKDQESIVVPIKDLEQYAGGTMGFFIVSDGDERNNYDRGDEFNINSHQSGHGPGFRGSGINSAENDYILFSDHRWNPKGGKDYTKWTGSGKQFWEDLIDGDDDYDDLKFYHIIEWRTENDNFDGVLCYVYENAAPPKVTRPINPQVQCDTRLLKSGFKDIVLQRQDCGSMVAGTEQYTIDYECGRCTGGYSNRMNQSQTIEVVTGGTFLFTSGGGITNGILGECTKFKIRVKKNGTQVYEKNWLAAHWPPIGSAITEEISVSSGDTLTFEVPEIINGGPNASVSPALHLYNSESSAYESSFTINLITLNGDDVIAQSVGNPATNEQTNPNGGITGLAMQYKPSTASEFTWMPGSHKSETYHIDADDSTNGMPATKVWENSAAVNMRNLKDTDPNHPGVVNEDVIIYGSIRGDEFTEHKFPKRTSSNSNGNLDGYIDTGILAEGVDGYDMSDEEAIQELTGNYNHILEEYLVTDFRGTHPTLAHQGNDDECMEVFKRYAPLPLARGALPWYVATGGIDDEDNLQNVGFYNCVEDMPGYSTGSPVTFYHDYILDGLKGKDANMIQEPAKVRIGITFYSLMNSDKQRRTASTGRFYYWQAVIHVQNVIEPGKGYATGMEFDLFWPPIRDKRTERAGTPYYPDNEPDPETGNSYRLPRKNLIAYYEDEDAVDRFAKEVIYQDSSDNTSAHWYMCSDKKKERVRFKIIINDVN